MRLSAREPTRLQANYALIVLLLAYILSFIDRNAMAVLIGPIRQEFAISDFQYSLLHGLAFSLFYIGLGLPIARLADRGNRTLIISIGVFVWSVMTCLCGLARSFTSLFLARMGVGIGEAALSPPAYSLLADFFSEHNLPRAIAVYTLGITIGGGLAYIIGSEVYQYFDDSAEIVLPLVGALKPWQMTFIAVGLPGLVIVAMLALVREPRRRGVAQQANVHHASIADLGAQLKRHWRAYLGLVGGMCLLAVLGYATTAWYPEFLMRTYGVERTVAGGQFGLIFLVAGSLGVIVGGWSVAPFERRGYKDAPLRIVLICAVLWMPPAIFGPLAPTPGWAVLAACPIMFFLNAFFSVGISGLQLITPNNMRAQISALMVLSTNIFSLALGPMVVGFLTDFVFGDDQDLRYSLAVLPVALCPIAIFLAWQGLGAYKRARVLE